MACWLEQLKTMPDSNCYSENYIMACCRRNGELVSSAGSVVCSLQIEDSFDQPLSGTTTVEILSRERQHSGLDAKSIVDFEIWRGYGGNGRIELCPWHHVRSMELLSLQLNCSTDQLRHAPDCAKDRIWISSPSDRRSAEMH